MSDASKEVNGLSDDTRSALSRLILALADGKRILGIRYSDWLLGAPSIEAGIAMSSMCQDEWGHARLLYAMLKDLGHDPVVVEHDRTAAEYANPSALDGDFTDWAGVVAAILLMDGALSVAIGAFSEGGFEKARTRGPKMIAEETFHHDMGAAWFRRFAKAEDEARSRLHDAAQSELPRILAWLDPQDEPAQALVDAGLMLDGAEITRRYQTRVGSLVASVGVDLASIQADRSGWDVKRGRGPGAPSEDAVERARGDRNRMLLVE
jgi:ring-1,2-phenylacetyl-CoA epoxidase subunit PaaC